MGEVFLRILILILKKFCRIQGGKVSGSLFPDSKLVSLSKLLVLSRQLNEVGAKVV